MKYKTTPFLTFIFFFLICISGYSQPLYQVHWTSVGDPVFSGSGGGALAQVLDSTCSSIQLSVADPNAPLAAFSPLIINPQQTDGNDLVDLSGNMSFYVRVRSRETVRLGLLLRSGDGTSDFRTNRLEETIPGDTTSWTELAFTFDTSQLGGFDSTDLRDVWFYLDRGDENFAGDAFWVDYFAFGEKPDPATHSSCSLFPPFEFPWVLHWADTLDQITSGSGAEFITQIVDTTCSQIGLSITEPILFPHPAFRPIRLDPLDQFGNDLKDLSGQLRLYARVRSLEEVEFSAILRGGGGAQEERSKLLSQTIPAGLGQWTEVVFDFSGANREGFDATDLRDVFLYLNREEANFPGNEFYFDYISLGSPPDTAENSTCVATVGISLPQLTESILVYPNPLQKGETLQVELDTKPGTFLRFSLLSLTGQVIQQREQISQENRYALNWEHLNLSQGLYLLKIESELGYAIHKINIH